MASVTTAMRLRRSAALSLLFACAVACRAGTGFAQQSVGNEYYGPDTDAYNEYAPSSDWDSGPVYQPSRPAHIGWVGIEYLHWELDGSDLPPLVTDGPATTPIDDAGELDDPDTRILAGDETVGDDGRDGYRIFAGMWLDCGQCVSISADYFEVGDDDFDYQAGPDPNRIVTRPFFNTETGEDDAELVSVPNELDGTVDVSADDDFHGAGLTLNRCVWRYCDPCTGWSSSVRALGGYRHYKYNSELSITENLTVLPGTTQPLVPGTTIFVEDEFSAHNEFHGAEIGLQGWLRQSGAWWIDGLAKFAIGGNRRVVIVDGDTVNTVPGAGSAAFEGGLLTSEVTNIGRYDDTKFDIIPELRVGVGGMVVKGVAVHAGYNLIFWGDVARASSHLPPGLAVDPRNIPPVQPGGGPEPEFPGIRGSDLFAHGFDLSIQFTY